MNRVEVNLTKIKVYEEEGGVKTYEGVDELPEGFIKAVISWMQETGTKYLIFGHTCIEVFTGETRLLTQAR
jgi:hypothetical protein